MTTTNNIKINTKQFKIHMACVILNVILKFKLQKIFTRPRKELNLDKISHVVYIYLYTDLVANGK